MMFVKNFSMKQRTDFIESKHTIDTYHIITIIQSKLLGQFYKNLYDRIT